MKHMGQLFQVLNRFTLPLNVCIYLVQLNGCF